MVVDISKHDPEIYNTFDSMVSVWDKMVPESKVIHPEEHGYNYLEGVDKQLLISRSIEKGLDPDMVKWVVNHFQELATYWDLSPSKR